MLFGLSNIPACFQGYINKILTKKLDIFILVYLNNILIYIEDLKQPHIKAIQLILEQLQKHGLYVNLKKCQFHEDKI